MPKKKEQISFIYKEGRRTADGQPTCFFEPAGYSANNRAIREFTLYFSYFPIEQIDNGWEVKIKGSYSGIFKIYRKPYKKK